MRDRTIKQVVGTFKAQFRKALDSGIFLSSKTLQQVKEDVEKAIKNAASDGTIEGRKLEEVLRQINLDYKYYGTDVKKIIKKVLSEVADKVSFENDAMEKSRTRFADLRKTEGWFRMPLSAISNLWQEGTAQKKTLVELEKELEEVKSKIKQYEEKIIQKAGQAPDPHLEKSLKEINKLIKPIPELKKQILEQKSNQALLKKLEAVGIQKEEDITWENIVSVNLVFISADSAAEKEESILTEDDIEAAVEEVFGNLSEVLEELGLKISGSTLSLLAGFEAEMPDRNELLNTLRGKGLSLETAETFVNFLGDFFSSGAANANLTRELLTIFAADNSAMVGILGSVDQYILSPFIEGLETSGDVVEVIQGTIDTGKRAYQLSQDIMAMAKIGERARIATVASDLIPMLADLMNAMPSRAISESLKQQLMGDWQFDAHLHFDNQRDKFVQAFNDNRAEYIRKMQEGTLGLYELKMIQGVLANEPEQYMEKWLLKHAMHAKVHEVESTLRRGLVGHDQESIEEYLRSIHALGASIQLATQAETTVSTEANKQILRSASLMALNAALVSLAASELLGVGSPISKPSELALKITRWGVDRFTEDRAEKIKAMIEKISPAEMKILLDQIVAGGRETAAIRVDLLGANTVEKMLDKRAAFISELNERNKDIAHVLPGFKNIESRWRYIDDCINKLHSEHFQGDREKTLRCLLAAQDFTSVVTFDQAASTCLRQPLCNAISESIDIMSISDEVKYLLKRELDRINLVVPPKANPEIIIDMMSKFAENFDELRGEVRFGQQMKDNDVVLQTLSQVNADLQQFQLDAQKQHPQLLIKEGLQTLKREEQHLEDHLISGSLPRLPH